jgi:hypothetical protein
MDIYNPVYPGLYYFDTFTFTTLGTSGHRGPDSTKTYANAPWREGDFSTWIPYQEQSLYMAVGTWSPELGRFICALGYSDATNTF